MAASIETLRRDGCRIGDELIIDAAAESLRQAATRVLSVEVGAITPDELPAPAPAPSAPDNMDVEAPAPLSLDELLEEDEESARRRREVEVEEARRLAAAPTAAAIREAYAREQAAAQPAEAPAAAPASDEQGRVAVGAVGVPAAAPVPAPAPAPTPRDIATALADLGVRVDMTSAADNPFLLLLLKVARAARLVEGERGGKFLPQEWILATSLDYYFRKGMLPLEPGKRGSGEPLRQFLATLLNRAPMAITKKFIAEEMELGEVYFKPQVVDLTKAVRTFRDQVEAFVASQGDRPYHGVSEEKSRSKNPWRAYVTIPTEHRKVRDKFETVYLGVFPTKKAAACAVDEFIKNDYRFDEAYVRKNSNRIKYKKDFETMTEEMKAAAKVGRLAALKEAPAPAPAAPGGTAPSAAAKPRAKPAAAKPRAARRAAPPVAAASPGQYRGKSTIYVDALPPLDSFPAQPMPAYDSVINFNRSTKANTANWCVMCGKPSGTGDGCVKIPSNNKDVCNTCDSTFWKHNESGAYFKWCKGKKNFQEIHAFLEVRRSAVALVQSTGGTCTSGAASDDPGTSIDGAASAATAGRRPAAARQRGAARRRARAGCCCAGRPHDGRLSSHF